MTRRAVRVTAELYHQLEKALPAERGPRGEPTVGEFASTSLLDIVATFEGMWDEMPLLIAGRSDYRIQWFTTRYVPQVSVVGQLSPRDGVIELVRIKLDFTRLPGPNGPNGPDDQEDQEDEDDD